ncbi:CD82 antigen [Musca domestica]|uniref:Tetraspanin n=1 Tax=Musca domestica TaxID=7370 RepID=T1P8U3_MUSDO|nr:CD82 antigen [Musca domestica]XP_011291214.1 CD82 antigen [Musca domestica]XP_019891231.1 CD82 antigen [Musca domestica]XP_019891232.1 CD82 antigen [Musca domestica]XP_058979288.1 CD82 antigen [Musca domestica]
MGLNGCCSCVKFLMVLFNILFWVIGLAIVIASAWLLTDPTFVLSMTQSYNHYYIALYVFLGIGVLITIGAFFGCCGVLKESQCLLVSFFCVILVVMVAQIAAGAWAFHNKDKLDDIVRASVKYSVQEEYGQSSMSSRTVTFDTIQKNLKCCGADGPADWATSRFNNVDRTNIVDIAISSMNVFYNIPESCCKDELKENVCEMSRKLKFGGTINPAIHQQGCVDKLIEVIYENWVLLFGITGGIVLLELLALTLSLSLCCAVRSQQYKA